MYQLQAKMKEKSTAQVMVNDITAFVNCFYACNFSHIHRSCNKVAHAMTKTPLTFEELVWLEECPPTVLSLVQADKCLI